MAATYDDPLEAARHVTAINALTGATTVITTGASVPRNPAHTDLFRLITALTTHAEAVTERG